MRESEHLDLRQAVRLHGLGEGLCALVANRVFIDIEVGERAVGRQRLCQRRCTWCTNLVAVYIQLGERAIDLQRLR